MNRETLVFKRVLLDNVKSKYKKLLTSTPKVEVQSLGFFVDGGRANKDDFKSKYELMADDETTTVKDADNNFHENITKTQMKEIWKAIVLNGESILMEKWQKEGQIKACTTIEELEAIEI